MGLTRWVSHPDLPRAFDSPPLGVRWLDAERPLDDQRHDSTGVEVHSDPVVWQGFLRWFRIYSTSTRRLEWHRGILMCADSAFGYQMIAAYFPCTPRWGAVMKFHGTISQPDDNSFVCKECSR